MTLKQPGQQLSIEYLMAHCKHSLKSLTSTLDACTGGFVDQVKQHAALGSIFGLNVSHQVDKAPQQGPMWKKSVEESEGGVDLELAGSLLENMAGVASQRHYQLVQ